jgi:long-subunit acyl-CoA synthetase (AMP-forming)
MKDVDTSQWSEWEEYKTSEGHTYYFNASTMSSSWKHPRELLEEQVMSKFKDVLGGKTQFLVTGGALTSHNVIEFLHKCFNCPVYDVSFIHSKFH